MHRFILSSLFLFVAFLSQADTLPVISNLKTCNTQNPVGVSAIPYFGWQVSDTDTNEFQTAYQILIATSPEFLSIEKADVWNSGKLASDKLNYNYLPENIKLLSDTKYFWTVKCWDKNAKSGDFAKPASFVVGLTQYENWGNAFWIHRKTNDKNIYSSYLTHFSAKKKKIQRATVYISASHSFELSLNAKFCGKASNFHYPQYTYYQAFDVTNQLKKGKKNEIKIDTHWYGGGQGRAPGKDALLCKLSIKYADGNTQEVISDESWSVSKIEKFNASQAQRGGEGIGYIDLIDSRLENSKPEPVELLGKASVKPFINALQPDLTRPVEEIIKPVSIRKSNDGKYLIDLGKIYAGRFQIKFKNADQAGDTIKLAGGFLLNEDGTVNEKLTQSTKMQSYFVLGGKNTVFLPEVYLGMRYLQIENYKSDLHLDEVDFITRRYELDNEEASFHSSSEILDQVWNLMAHSVKGGFQEGLVDTPTREKGGFLSDGWSQGAPALTVFGDRKMNDRVLKEFFESQEQYWPDGRYNAVYPNVDGGRDIPDFTQQFLFWVWDYYLQTGNKEFLQKHYAALRKTGDYLISHLDTKVGLIKNLSGGKGPYEFGIIDWPADMRFGYDMQTDYRTVINAYAYLDFRVLEIIAAKLEMKEDKQLFHQLAVDLRKTMYSKLINEKGVFVDGLKSDLTQSHHSSQQANSIPLAVSICIDQSVVDKVKSMGMRSGMVTLRFLTQSLGESGQAEALYDLFTNTEDYGWANTLKQGATFTWECWTAIQTDQSVSHPWGASGLIAMQNYFLGIKTLEPQNRVVEIRPLDFSGVNDLNFVSGSYKVDQGDITLKWSRTETTYQLDIEIPVNVEAEVYIPNKSADFEILMDGQKTAFEQKGDYLYLGKVGSGKHTILRKINIF